MFWRRFSGTRSKSKNWWRSCNAIYLQTSVLFGWLSLCCFIRGKQVSLRVRIICIIIYFVTCYSEIESNSDVLGHSSNAYSGSTVGSDPSMCTTPCTGDSTQTCGESGSWKDVFMLGKKDCVSPGTVVKYSEKLRIRLGLQLNLTLLRAFFIQISKSVQIICK